MLKKALLVACMALAAGHAASQTPAAAPKPQYDAELAKSLGGNDNGMRPYVLVILKTGPNKVTDPEARKKEKEPHQPNLSTL